MVAVFNKEFLGWYFITLKLREAVGSAVAGAPMLEFPENHEDEETRSPDFEWVISINKQIEQAGQENEARSWSKLSIYRVPHYLREVDKKAYVPQVISLGPYHRGKKHLRKMDKHKWRCLHHVMQRTNQDIKLYLDTAREMEAKARSCYEGPINLSINEFVEMMVLDGCFMLELFRGVVKGFEELGYHRNDPVFATRGSINFIMRDMIMLENQLPLFVLDRFLRLQLNNSYHKGLLVQLALEFFYPLTPTPIKIPSGIAASFDPLSVMGGLHCLHVFQKNLLRPGPKPRSVQGGLHCLHVFRKSLLRLWPKRQSVQGGLHCLHVFRKSLLRLWPKRQSVQGGLHCLHVFRKSLLRLWPKRQSVQGDLHCLDVFRKSLLLLWPKRPSVQGDYQSIHCVTELREAGIKFRKRETDRFWDVKFKKGILRVPSLLVDDGTKSLFLNLIALEQCHIGCGNKITSYVVFMDSLINSPEDVAYLHYCGIIEHCLGSDADVADLFNQLCQEVVFDINDRYLSRLFNHVNRSYNNKWNNWRASLKHNYFSNPWAIISLFAAVVLLLLTFTQAFYAVYVYYRPRS